MNKEIEKLLKIIEEEGRFKIIKSEFAESYSIFDYETRYAILLGDEIELLPRDNDDLIWRLKTLIIDTDID